MAAVTVVILKPKKINKGKESFILTFLCKQLNCRWMSFSYKSVLANE